MKKIKAIILGNELEDDHLLWVKACESYWEQVDYRIVNLTKDNWLDEIQLLSFDILLAKPGGLTAPYKQLYDERIYILEIVLGYKLYPSADEIFIYENKRFFSYWLKANNIPHASTHVFYSQAEVSYYLNNASYPLVAKVNIGSSGSGITVLKNKQQAITYVDETFSGKGALQRSGPNLIKGGLIKRGMHYIFHPWDISKKLFLYYSIRSNPQKGFVIIQDYIPHEFEWRVVRIGDSYFAHKKIKIGDKASGSTIKQYDNPPLSLFDFVKTITDKHKFYSMAVDVFEDENRNYLVNEMQCMFGQSDAFQMLVDGRQGRYKFEDNQWIFEEGDFCSNECFNLRIDWILKIS